MMAADTKALAVLELRRYVMKPGRRDDLIALFEREFIEAQEACGMLPVGHYRNLEDPDEFIWFRSFPDMASRRESLEAFYGRSDAWRNNRDAANETMIDSDNVLLLRPAAAQLGLDVDGLVRPAIGETPSASSFVGVAVFMLRARADREFLGHLVGVLSELRAFAERIALLETEDAKNDFRLPVREGEWAVTVAGCCAEETSLEAFLKTLQRACFSPELREQLIGAEFLRLAPAARSLYR